MKREAEAGKLRLSTRRRHDDAFWINLRPGFARSPRGWLQRDEPARDLDGRRSPGSRTRCSSAPPCRRMAPSRPPTGSGFRRTRRDAPRSRRGALLASIGLTDRNGDGRSRTRETPVRFTLVTQKGRPRLERGVSVIRDELEKIGIADVVALDATAVIEQIMSGNTKPSTQRVLDGTDPAAAPISGSFREHAPLEHRAEDRPRSGGADRRADGPPDAVGRSGAERHSTTSRRSRGTLPAVYFAAPRMFAAVPARDQRRRPCSARSCCGRRTPWRWRSKAAMLAYLRGGSRSRSSWCLPCPRRRSSWRSSPGRLRGRSPASARAGGHRRGARATVWTDRLASSTRVDRRRGAPGLLAVAAFDRPADLILERAANTAILRLRRSSRPRSSACRSASSRQPPRRVAAGTIRAASPCCCPCRLLTSLFLVCGRADGLAAGRRHDVFSHRGAGGGAAPPDQPAAPAPAGRDVRAPAVAVDERGDRPAALATHARGVPAARDLARRAEGRPGSDRGGLRPRRRHAAQRVVRRRSHHGGRASASYARAPARATYPWRARRGRLLPPSASLLPAPPAIETEN